MDGNGLSSRNSAVDKIFIGQGQGTATVSFADDNNLDRFVLCTKTEDFFIVNVARAYRRDSLAVAMFNPVISVAARVINTDDSLLVVTFADVHSQAVSRGNPLLWKQFEIVVYADAWVASIPTPHTITIVLYRGRSGGVKLHSRAGHGEECTGYKHAHTHLSIHRDSECFCARVLCNFSLIMINLCHAHSLALLNL